jgi:hypothetical protein
MVDKTCVTVIPCGTYQHYKGGKYLVLGVAEDEATGAILVIYVSLDATKTGPRMRARLLDNFFAYVPENTTDTMCKIVPRFTFVGYS